jgi:hypothetical protein
MDRPGFAVGGWCVWAANGICGTVSAIDTATPHTHTNTNTVTATTNVGRSPRRVVATSDVVCIALHEISRAPTGQSGPRWSGPTVDLPAIEVSQQGWCT